MGVTTQPTKRSSLYAVEPLLVSIMPPVELRDFKQWYAKARIKHANDPLFYRPGQKAGASLLRALMAWIYGFQRPQGDNHGIVRTSSWTGSC